MRWKKAVKAIGAVGLMFVAFTLGRYYAYSHEVKYHRAYHSIVTAERYAMELLLHTKLLEKIEQRSEENYRDVLCKRIGGVADYVLHFSPPADANLKEHGQWVAGKVRFALEQAEKTGCVGTDGRAEPVQRNT